MNEVLATPSFSPLSLLETGPETIFSVSSLARAIKQTLEGTYGFVKIKGEVSGAKLHSSGHLYFALKDTEAVIDGVCWRPVASRLGYALEDGMEVICTGRLTTYPNRSKYQIVAERIELAGEGALLKVLEDRKKRLLAEGLFAPERKRPLPFLPHTIGIVTSPTGAVIQDILHRLEERFPRHVLLWPVAVQGEGAAPQIAAAIEGFNALPLEGPVPRPDVLIVARGGGSLEDLWAFNEECVVRAVAGSHIPVISAVGHETDTTLIDYASDLRAPTPTAAAEKVVPVRQQLWLQVQEWGHRIPQALQKLISHHQVVLQGLGRGIPSLKGLMEEKTQRMDDMGERLLQSLSRSLAVQQERLLLRGRTLRHPGDLLKRGEQKLDALSPRLVQSIKTIFQEKNEKARMYQQLLESFSPHQVLERGYAMVWDCHSGSPVTRLSQVEPPQEVRIRFYDGDTRAAIGEDSMATEKPGGPKKRAISQPQTASQGRLW
jgi:exodeoxyribonuclease VII large subunit